MGPMTLNKHVLNIVDTITCIVLLVILIYWAIHAEMIHLPV